VDPELTQFNTLEGRNRAPLVTPTPYYTNRVTHCRKGGATALSIGRGSKD